MALKDGAKSWTIREQIIEDLPTGITIQFETVPDDEGAPFRLRLFGDFPFGNREILFDRDGREVGGGTLTAGLCKPSWLISTEDPVGPTE